MTCATWTTESQCEWLEKILPEWRNAQEGDASKDFRAQVLLDWKQEFPLEPPTAKELEKAGGDENKARQTKGKKMNHVRGFSST